MPARQQRDDGRIGISALLAVSTEYGKTPGYTGSPWTYTRNPALCLTNSHPMMVESLYIVLQSATDTQHVVTAAGPAETSEGNQIRTFAFRTREDCSIIPPPSKSSRRTLPLQKKRFGQSSWSMKFRDEDEGSAVMRSRRARTQSLASGWLDLSSRRADHEGS